ncbi:ABC transporter ATP-binding protein [Streptomyces aidingensis]|uniref:Peptide/nickel transport system ATP-binding protein n=1 Tax=Streptomyces aidingensis TaxID=910347 RepID=A0A1I1JL21_9ACTN|nr:ABC transporter ATP-binding protein [Streptomyces aidingensis]SFC48871.1 peptide/nickel transport system ATP-binding protein [Streptomyces aidingensis]
MPEMSKNPTGVAAAEAAGDGSAAPPPLLEISGLRTHFTTREGVVKAVDGVDLAVGERRTVCVVGESGCGKSVTARSILGLVDRPGEITGGSILWRGGDRTSPVDLAKLDPHGEELRRIRGGEISMVFQEPMASLSPMYTIGDQLTETIRLHLPMTKAEAKDHAIAMLRKVGIPKPEQRFNAYSFQLSGGMCQRAMIAIALACGPGLLIADEPTTALDVTIQARILDLIASLQESSGMSVMFITHDLGVVAEIADEVVVMYLGTVVERGPVDEIFHDPKHPYTQALLDSVPAMGQGRGQRLRQIRGRVPHPSERAEGCPFHPRCDSAIAGVCDTTEPPETVFGPDRTARCVLYTPGLGTPGNVPGDTDPAEEREVPANG